RVPEPATAAPQSDRPMGTRDISPAAKVHRAIQVTSQPAGARIFNGDDAEAACETPCTLQAGPGTYKLQLHFPGYAPDTREVQVAAKNVEIDVPMSIVRGSVIVEAPPDATLKVDGSPVPNPLPVELSLLPGLHRITVEKVGVVQERIVNLKPEARLRLRAM